jgi:hypothetical protein
LDAEAFEKTLEELEDSFAAKGLPPGNFWQSGDLKLLCFLGELGSSWQGAAWRTGFDE